MGSDETAITVPGGPRVIDVFDGNGAPSGPNYLLFSDVDRLADALWDRSKVGWSPTPHTPSMQQPSAPGELWKQPWPITAKNVWVAKRNRPKMLEAAAHAV